MNDIQLRGNCQICGRQHAVVRGQMAKHGYEVKNGYFRGVCGGQHAAPLQQDRSVLDRNVAFWLNEEVPGMLAAADRLERGEVFPKEAASGPGWRAPMVPFAEAPLPYQKAAVERAVVNLRNAARHLQGHAEMMSKFADEVFGQPLIEVKKVQGPAPILPGERRIGGGGQILIVRYVQGARVYWKREDGFGSWTGSSAWRKLEIAPAQ